MSDVNFFDTPIEDLPEKRDLPVGDELVFTPINYRRDKSAQKGTEIITVILVPSDVVASDEVTEDNISNYRPIYHKFFMTEGAHARLKHFLRDLSVEGADVEGVSYRELCENMVTTGPYFIRGTVTMDDRGRRAIADRSFRPLDAI